MKELAQYWIDVEIRFEVGTERYGQAAFNHLCAVHEKLSEKIRGTDKDPFYLVNANGARWDAFVEYVNTNW